MKESAQKIMQRSASVARAPRTRKIAIWFLSIVIAIGVLGALVAPYVLRRVLSDQLTAKLHRPVTIEQIRINPYAMTATVRGFLMKERDGAATAVSFDELHLNLQLMSLFRWSLVVEELRLVKPYINLVRQEDFKYNFQDLIDGFMSGPSESGPTPRFALNNIQITDGKIDFDDRPEQTKHSIDSIHLGVPFISSLPSYSDIFVKPAFAAVINGTPLDIKGDTKPFKDSFESVVQVNIDDLQIPKYLAYSPVDLNFTVPTGRIDGKLTAWFKTARGQDPVVIIAAEMALRDLVMQEKSGAPLLNLPAFDIGIDSVGVFARKASIKTMKAQGLELHVKRRADGSFNVANLTVAPPDSPQAKTAPATETNKVKKDQSPFFYQVEQFLLESGKLHYT
ncbi:MAG: AsmA family protein, partial [Candidatus Binatia bacterium]